MPRTSEYRTRYRDDGRLTLMTFWHCARRRRWLIFRVLRVTDYLPPEEQQPWR